MSYSIIFETKICRLSDGKIIHFSLSGCNNDNAGRTRNDWRGKLYDSEEDFLKYVSRFDEYDAPHVLKINSRWCSQKQYAEHLRRMLNRACSFKDLSLLYGMSARIFTGETVFLEDGSCKEYSPKEWDKVCYDYWFGHIPSRKMISHYKFSSDEKEIVEILENNGPVSFYIGRKNKSA